MRGQFLQYLGLMRKQIAPLAAAFTFPAAKDLPERGLHVGRLHNLLDDMTNSAHKYLFLFLIRGLQSPGPGFFEPFPAYQTLPDTLFFSFPALADRCYCGLPPSAPRWGQVPGVVRRLKFPFDCCSDENRCSCSYSRNRCSHSTSKHRHSGSRCCCHDRPHGLWGGATFQMQKYYFQIII